MAEWFYLFRREARIEIKGDVVLVRSLRDHKHKKRAEQYLDKEYSLKNLAAVWYAIEPLHLKRFAHTFFVFDFGQDSLVASVEAKRKVGQIHPVIWGFLPFFPLTYAFTTERDMFELRADHRNKDIFMYRLRLNRKEVKKLFLEVARRHAEIQSRQMKFNSAYRNCTTESINCLLRTFPEKLGKRPLLCANVDEYLDRHRLINVYGENLESARQKHNVGPFVRKSRKKAPLAMMRNK